VQVYGVGDLASHRIAHGPRGLAVACSLLFLAI